MTLIEAIRALLVSAGIEAFIVDAPEEKLSAGAVVLLPYGGETDETLPLSTVHFQVRASAATFTASEALCWRAFQALEGAAPDGADRQVIGRIAARQEPFFLGKEGELYIHEFNAQVAACWKE